MDYSVVAMFGATAGDAAAHFIALPRGWRYPGDAADLKGLLYRLSSVCAASGVPGVRLWDNLSVAGAREETQAWDPSSVPASISSTFYHMQPSEMHSLDGLDRFDATGSSICCGIPS